MNDINTDKTETKRISITDALIVANAAINPDCEVLLSLDDAIQATNTTYQICNKYRKRKKMKLIHFQSYLS